MIRIGHTISVLARAIGLATVATALAAPADASLVKLDWVKVYGVERLTNNLLDNKRSRLIPYDGALYLAASDPAHGRELWKWDGTTLSMAADIVPGAEASDPSSFIVYDGALYFSATTAATGRELYRFDGNTASLAVDIVPGAEDSLASPLIEHSGALYLLDRDPDHGGELWKWDGTTASLVADLWPGPLGSQPVGLIVYDGALYFEANDGSSGRDLWRYDGSAVSHAADISSAGGALTWNRARAVYDGFLYFTYPNGELCEGLCRFDGTTVLTVADLPPTVGAWSPTAWLTVYKSDLYFTTDSENVGTELWLWDGEAIRLVADIWPGPAGSNPSSLTVFDGELFNTASTPQHGSEFRRGSSLVTDIRPGPKSAAVSSPTVHGDGLYFTAADGIHDRQLWRLKRTGRVPRIFGELVLPYEEWWEWPIQPGNQTNRSAGTLGLVAISAGEAPRLLTRRETRLGSRGPELTYDSDLLDPQSVPESLAFATVVFHDATGRIAASAVEVVSLEGEPEQGVREALESEGKRVLADLTLEDLRAMEVREFPAADLDRDEPDEPTTPQWGQLLSAAIGLAVIFVLALLLRRLSVGRG